MRRSAYGPTLAVAVPNPKTRSDSSVRSTTAYAVDEAGQLVGGCVGSTVDVWHWLTVDVMWVDPGHRRRGIGRELLATVEDQARVRTCRWARLNTWEFQAPEFYARLGMSSTPERSTTRPGTSTT